MTKTVPERQTRRVAGEDPDKRAAILAGAARVFLQSGFDAASMNDICRAAGVSKSTLYVYFANKEDLFEHLIATERERLFQGLRQTLTTPGPLAERLTNFAIALANIVCSDEVIRAQRIVIAMAERRPDLGAKFYDSGAQRGHATLLETLKAEIALGTLHIADAELAAYQLVELASAGLWRRRIFGKNLVPPDAKTIRANAISAVALFMAGYARR